MRLAVVMHEHKLLAKLVLEVPQIAPRPLLDLDLAVGTESRRLQ